MQSPVRVRRYRAASVCALLVFVVASFSAAGQAAGDVERRCGWSPGLPGRVQHAGVEPGLNVALDQYDDAGLARALDTLWAAGVRWLRQEFRWADLEPRQGEFDWRTSDRILAATDGRGFKVLAVLVTSPEWARDTGIATEPPRNPVLFVPFATAFAERYGARLDYYEIWDEPNIALGWGGLPIMPEEYAALLAAGATALRAADTGATIVLAGLAPTVETGSQNLSDILFLRRLYEADAAQYFDVVAAKPYGFGTGPDDRRFDPQILNFSRMLLLREEMEAHGDAGKALWASHLGWNALPPGWTGGASLWGQVDEATQAAYTARAVERARLEWPWAGVLFFANYEPPVAADDPFWGFSMLAPDGRSRPVFAALQQALAVPPYAYPGAYLAGPTAYARFEGRWRFSELGADSSEPVEGQPLDRATLEFYGTDLCLTVRRADYRGHFYVAIDGRPANALPQDEHGAYLILTSPDNQGHVDTLPVARDLSPGAHTAEIIADRGWGQWSFDSFVVGYAPGRVAAERLLWGTAALAVVALIAGAVLARRAAWGALLHDVRERYIARSRVFQVITTWLAAALFYGTVWLAWGDGLAGIVRPGYARLGEGGQVALLAVLTALCYFSPWLPVVLLALLVLGVAIYFRLDLGLALAVFCAPFFMLPIQLWSYGFAMTSIVVWLCLAAWLWDALARWRLRLRTADGRPAPRWGLPDLRAALGRVKLLDAAVGMLLIVATLSLFGAEYLRQALNEYRIIVLEPALLYALIRVARLDRAQLWRLADALVLSGLAVAVIGLGQYALGVNLITAEGGLMRLRSIYGSPDNVGLFLGRVVPVLAAVVLIARGTGGAGRVRRWAYALAAVPIGLALLLSFSRGAWLLGVPAALAVVLLLWDRRRGALILGALAVVAVIGFVVLLQNPRYAERLSLTGETSLTRVNLWQSSLIMIRDHPLLGVGPDNFLYAYRGHYIHPDAWREPDLSHPHNWILDFAARLGLLGLAAALLLQGAFWRAALRAWRACRAEPLMAALVAGLMGAMADFLAHGLVDNSYFLVDLAVVFMMSAAVAATLDKAPAEDKAARG